MNNSNNPTGSNGREMKVSLSDDFINCDLGFIIVGVDSKELGKIQTVKTMKIKSDFQNMKSAGKLRKQTPEIIEARNRQNQEETR